MMTNTFAEENGGTLTSASNDAASQQNADAGLAAPRWVATKVVPLSLQESERAVLRPIVAQIEDHMAALQVQWSAGGFAETSPVLVAQWRSLVELMALGTPPKLRSCPHCGYRINAVATRCIQCWKMSERA